ncbi:M23 family metallopeptidase [Priestia aryabhattai]|uniref:M23 family metallopeptidase n=1 Tax=Priestia megaterium TaxID=1404 RepID=UPI0039B8BC4E
MGTEKKVNIREKFGTLFAEGNFKKLYACVSEEFKHQVSLQQFLEQGKLFNQGEQFYRLETNLDLTPQIEQFIWLNSMQTKAISVMFDEHNIIQALVLMPIESFSDRGRWSTNKYTMPIQSEWFVYWGGEHEALNYHYPVENQRYAYDLVVRKGKQSYKNEGMKNEDYYAYGKKVVAPLEGVVFAAVGDQEDNEIGQTNKKSPLGNYVIIEHKGKEYSVLAHLKKGSVFVKKGDIVRKGTLLGRCGNSGNSSEPHVHFHVMDASDIETSKSLRIKFHTAIEPIRGDTVIPFFY